MSDRSQLGDRMKLYEAVTQNQLVPRCPAIIRVDGRAFHTYTKGFDRPYDTTLHSSLRASSLQVLRRTDCAILAYGQSDEVSFLLIDYRKLSTSQCFDGNVQKIASITASHFTNEFNIALLRRLEQDPSKSRKLENKILRAQFDARVFSIPEDDVDNYFFWRHRDCIRNSVSSAARAHFSHKELMNKHSDDARKMLTDVEKPWEDMDANFKFGWLMDRSGEFIQIDDIRKTVQNIREAYLSTDQKSAEEVVLDA